jgi:hypothetical protein
MRRLPTNGGHLYIWQMKYVFEDIEAERLATEVKRRGIAPRQRLRVILETLEGELPLARAAEVGHAFDFLADEPDLYSEADIRRP